MPANIIPIPIVKSGVGLVDFKVHNGGMSLLAEMTINASGYLVTNGTVSPNTPIKIGTMPPDSYAGADIKVTPNVEGIIKTNQAVVTFNDPNNSGQTITINMPAHYIIAPNASPKVYWGSPTSQVLSFFTMTLATTSGQGSYSASGSVTAFVQGNSYEGGTLGLITSYKTFPNIGVVNNYPFGDAWHPSDLPISLGLAEQVTPFGRLLSIYNDSVSPQGSLKYFHSGLALGQKVNVTSGMYSDAYNDTYVFPSWDSINTSGTAGLNLTNINALVNYVSGGGRVLLMDDGATLFGYLSQFPSGVALPTTLPFNFAPLFLTSGTTTTRIGDNTVGATISLQNSGQTIIARSQDSITAQLIKPYNANDSEAVVASFSTFRSLLITSGQIGTGTFKFGIQESLSGYIIAGYAPYGSGHIYWNGAQGGSLVTTWALNALFMAAKKWTNDTISGGYGPG